MKLDMKWQQGRVFLCGLLVVFSGCPGQCTDTGLVMVTKDPQDVELSSAAYNTGSISLECEAEGYDPNLPVIWVKDDTTRLDNGPAPTGLKLTINQSLENKLRSSMGDVGSASNISQMLLQGVYHCEVSGIGPHQKVASSPASVTFKDTMQFKGYLKTGADVSHDWVVSTARDIKQDLTTHCPRGMKSCGVNSHNSSQGSGTAYDFTITYVLPTEDYDSSLIQLFPDAKVPRGMTALEVLDENLYETLKNATKARIEHLSLLNQATFSLHSLKGCPKDAGKEHVWNYTPLGETASSDVLCLKDGQFLPKETRQCLGNSSTGTIWGNVQQAETCFELSSDSLVTNDLERLNTFVIDRKNVGEKASELVNLTSDPNVLTYADIALSAEILHKLSQVTRKGKTVGVSIVAIVNNLMNADKPNMAYAQRVNGSAARIIQSLEKYSLTANLRGKQTVRIRSDDIALEMWDLSKISLNGGQSGLGHQEMKYDNVKKRKMNLVHYNSTDDVVFSNTEAAIIMSDGVKQQIQELYDNSEETKPKNNRLAFVIYRHPKLFLTPDQLQFPEHHSPINSEIVAIKLSFHDMQLTEPILTIFRPKENKMGTATCVHWDFDVSEDHWDWSTQGCSVNTTEEGRVLCQCKHLAYFMETSVATRISAKPSQNTPGLSPSTPGSPKLPDGNIKVSLDTSEISQAIFQRRPIAHSYMTAFGLVTYCSLGLSSIGLLLTIISFMLFRKNLPWSHGHEILVNLAVALFSINVILLVGHELTENKYVCTAVAALLHYLLLVTFSLLLVEAVLQYYHYATDNFLKRFMLKTVLPSWVFPAVLVVAILCTDYRVYWDTSQYCWPKNESLYFTLVLPVGVIAFINIVLYVCIIKDIVSDKLRSLSDQVLFEMTMMRILRRLSVFGLLGLIWAFGFLAMARANVVFNFVFCILNTFPGILIFFFHVLKNRLVRYSWYTCLCPLTAKRRREARKVEMTSTKCAQESVFEIKTQAHSSTDV